MATTPTDTHPWGKRALYGATILTGAFLMFLVQPLAGKIITPEYGGAAQVWTVCLLFFQLAVLGGYGLTFALSHTPPRLQIGAYLLLLGASVLLVHIPTGASWSPDLGQDPVQGLLGKMMTYLALPCILLSTVSTMFQNWYRLSRQGDPYYLYSISNIGSLGALLAYPLLVEPAMTVPETLQYWTWGYWALCALAAITGVLLLKQLGNTPAATTETQPLDGSLEEDGDDRPAVTTPLVLQWLGLSTLGSVTLMAYTTHMTHNIAPVPLLWVIPLSLYLLTFIVCFAQKSWYHRPFFVIGTQVLLVFNYFYKGDPVTSVLIAVISMFMFCMLCHGELYAKRPSAKHLPGFYLVLALGGALGGVLINLVAPQVFNDYTEYKLITVSVGLLAIVIFTQHPIQLFYAKAMDKLYVVGLLIILALTFTQNDDDGFWDVVEKRRNFYGTTTVKLARTKTAMMLVNGTTIHGTQMIDPKEGRMIDRPTTYYSENSGAGLATQFARKHRNGTPLRLGVVGLGVGTLAAYTEKGDVLDYYEIDPKVTHIAQTVFRYLKTAEDKGATVSIFEGDGRRLLVDRLNANQPGQYDVLIIDAFSSDAIPIHLLTREARDIYLQHLKPDGVLLYHLSNNFLDLNLVTENLAVDLSKTKTTDGPVPVHYLAIFHNPKDGFNTPSVYSILSRDTWFFEALLSKEAEPQRKELQVKGETRFNNNVGVWTDHFSNLISVFQFMSGEAHQTNDNPAPTNAPPGAPPDAPAAPPAENH